MNTQVMKLGGDSLATADRIANIPNLVDAFGNGNRTVLVVSAVKGVTRNLRHVAELIDQRQYAPAAVVLEQTAQTHVTLSRELENLLQGERTIFSQPPLVRLLSWAKQPRQANLTPQEIDLLAAAGEPLSASMVAWTLNKSGQPAVVVDSANLLVTDGNFGNARVLLEVSRKLTQSLLGAIVNRGITPVVTGFYGADEMGCLTTLGPGGSDYSAACIAALIEARRVIFWKTVDGIHDGDPADDPESILHPSLTYDEATAIIARDGQVLHPETLPTLKKAGIPALVRNALNPEKEGTFIGPETMIHHEWGY